MQESEKPKKKQLLKISSLGKYVFEFVMLFLAVTLGFFVENQREQLSEREDEIRLVTTLLNDVNTDIKRVDEIIQLRTDRIRQNDSLYMLLYAPDRNEHMPEIYKYMRSARSQRTLFYQSNTMIYLANGGFQLISSRIVEEETRKYFLSVQDILASQQGALDLGQELTLKSRALADAEVSWILNHPDPSRQTVMKLYSTQPDLINDYANVLLHFTANCAIQIQFLKKIRQQAEQLATAIKKEYNL